MSPEIYLFQLGTMCLLAIPIWHNVRETHYLLYSPHKWTLIIITKVFPLPVYYSSAYHGMPFEWIQCLCKWFPVFSVYCSFSARLSIFISSLRTLFLIFPTVEHPSIELQNFISATWIYSSLYLLMIILHCELRVLELPYLPKILKLFLSSFFF